MRKAAWAILLLSAFFPLRAGNDLKNPDFTDGANEWEGDGELASVADAGSAPATLDQTAPSKATGLVIKLSHRDWTKVYQEFTPKFAKGTLSIVYKLSDGAAFSTDRNDYLNIGPGLGLSAIQPFNIGTGHFVMLVLDTVRLHLDYYDAANQPGSATQTFSTPIEKLFKKNDHMLYVAFPPGDGTDTLFHVGIESGKAK